MADNTLLTLGFILIFFGLFLYVTSPHSVYYSPTQGTLASNPTGLTLFRDNDEWNMIVEDSNNIYYNYVWNGTAWTNKTIANYWFPESVYKPNGDD